MKCHRSFEKLSLHNIFIQIFNLFTNIIDNFNLYYPQNNSYDPQWLYVMDNNEIFWI